MDYSFFIWSTATYIETRLKEEIIYSELETNVGFSYRHIREIFKECTGVSLSRYILQRKIANSAFEIVHTGKSLTEIASDYMFDSYDTFTRAFKRHINHNPSDLRSRKCKVKVGRNRILIGMFAPAIIDIENNQTPLSISWEVNDMLNKMIRTDQSCVLYGVPKVEYSFAGCTPFCVALKACLNYMGQEMDYAYIMAATGAAFRLRWNPNCWDGGNVDIMYIYEDGYEAFRKGFEAAGRSYRILKRTDSNKNEFIKFIKAEIDEGRPVIALGIIGPPEACLITGYRDDGNTLLGWNCFQDTHGYARGVKIDESGYFLCDNWWENECTKALISIGEKEEKPVSTKCILENAVSILTKDELVIEDDSGIAKIITGGQRAYDEWAKAIGNDMEFPENALLPLLFERIMCQSDAQCMVGEGRYYAACFLDKVGSENEKVADKCQQTANLFRRSADLNTKMDEAKGGYMQDEYNTRKFADPKVRKQIESLIYQAKEYEAKACELLKDIVAAI